MIPNLDGTATISIALLISLGGFLCTVIQIKRSLSKDSEERQKHREEEIKTTTAYNTRLDTRLERIAIDTGEIRSTIDTMAKKIDDHEKRITLIEMKDHFKEEKEEQK